MDDQQTEQTQASQPEGGERPSRFAAGASGERGGDRGDRGDRGGGRFRGGRGGRGGPGRRKQPIYADNEIVDYKDIARLRLAIDERGKILPRRKTHCTAHIQRDLTVAIKRARHLALLPFVPVDRRR
jgi:small subunit ribosomal protein S18